MAAALPSIWQTIITSAAVAAVISSFTAFGVDYLKHRRLKVELFQRLVLERKLPASERVWKGVNELVSSLAPYQNGSRAFESSPDTEWHEYQIRMRGVIREVYQSFEENALILGEPVMRVWTRYRQELDFFSLANKHSRGYMEELIRFCSDFPTDLKEAIKVSLDNPTISILSREEEAKIRKEVSDNLESRVEF